MTALDALLAEVDALDKAATKGPWEIRVAGIEGDNYVAATGPWYRLGQARGGDAAEDAAFIARARTLLPVLREIVRVQGEALQKITNNWNDGDDLSRLAHVRAHAALARAEALAKEVRDEA
jgi:hypothetical protein